MPPALKLSPYVMAFKRLLRQKLLNDCLSLSQGMCHSYSLLFRSFFFHFYFDARDTSIVSNSSIVTSISGVIISSVSIVCSSKLIL